MAGMKTEREGARRQGEGGGGKKGEARAGVKSEACFF